MARLQLPASDSLVPGAQSTRHCWEFTGLLRKRIALWTALLPPDEHLFLAQVLPHFICPIAITYTVVFTQDPQAVYSITASLVSGLHLIATSLLGWEGERNIQNPRGKPGPQREATFSSSFP